MTKIKYRVWDEKENRYRCGEEVMLDCEGTLLWCSFGEETLNNDDFEIEQWTGRCDINGTEIYENDVVSFRRVNGGKKGVVTFKDLMWMISGYMMYGITENNMHVLGNIHENPELIANKSRGRIL